MRSHILAGLAWAATLASAASSSSGTLGFSLGNVTPNKAAGFPCKAQADYEADLAAIAKNSDSRLVRVYTIADCSTGANVLAAAKKQGFQVVLGMWLAYDATTKTMNDAVFKNDTSALTSLLGEYKDQIYAVTVGSECLYRKELTGPQLAQYIQQVKDAAPGVKVGTADSWNKIADGTADAILADGGADILLANGFAYWQGAPLNNATNTFVSDYYQALERVEQMSGGRQIEYWTGETGWPTDGGSNYGPAIAGTQNAQTYFDSAVCSILNWGGNVFYFEAFDEPSKVQATGDSGKPADETHWGAMNVDRSPKFPISC